MQRDPRALLWDIQQAADAILRFVAGVDIRSYAEAELVHSAVERKFEIIGEALNQIAKLDPMLVQRIPHAREIVAFRNLLIHGYAVVEHDRVWRIARPPCQVCAPLLLPCWMRWDHPDAAVSVLLIKPDGWVGGTRFSIPPIRRLDEGGTPKRAPAYVLFFKE